MQDILCPEAGVTHGQETGKLRGSVAGPSRVVVRLGLVLLVDLLATGGDHLLDGPLVRSCHGHCLLVGPRGVLVLWHFPP